MAMGNPSSSSLTHNIAQNFAQALLLEQVHFIKQQLLQSKNNHYIRQFIAQSYIYSDQILLKNIIQLEQLNQVVQKYAFELNLGANILEFIGVAAQKTHYYITHSPITFHDLLSDENFETWLDKILELDQVRDYIAENLQYNLQIEHISLQLANQIVERNTPWLNYLRQHHIKHNQLGSKILSFIQEQQHHIELKLEQQIALTIRTQLSQIALLPKEELEDIALQLWADFKQRPLQEMISQLQSIDFEEFFILVYETWKELRESNDMQGIILKIVEGFYEYFGEYTLQELLHSVGLNENDLYSEAMRFIPYCLSALDEHSLLDDLIKALIEPFYLNQNTQQFIANYLSQHRQET